MIGYTLQLFKVIWKTAANPGETFTQSSTEKCEGFLHFTALNLTKYNEIYERFSLPVMSEYCFVKSVNPIRQTM